MEQNSFGKTFITWILCHLHIIQPINMHEFFIFFKWLNFSFLSHVSKRLKTKDAGKRKSNWILSPSQNVCRRLKFRARYYRLYMQNCLNLHNLWRNAKKILKNFRQLVKFLTVFVGNFFFASLNCNRNLKNRLLKWMTFSIFSILPRNFHFAQL